MWKRAVGGVLALGALVVGGAVAYGASQPKTWHVERSVIAAAAPQDVVPLLHDLARWQGWVGSDGMTFTLSDPSAGVGASYTWQSPGSHGKLTLTAADETGVAYEMTMEDSETPARGSVRVAPDGNATRVTWTDEGDFSAMGPLGGLMVPMMEKSLGPHFDGALKKLAGLAEKAAAERVEAEKAASAATPPTATDAPPAP
ncbi:MAG: SRPBCC family protein [Myxococcota bacterium]